jgi:hypothetical protein
MVTAATMRPELARKRTMTVTGTIRTDQVWRDKRKNIRGDQLQPTKKLVSSSPHPATLSETSANWSKLRFQKKPVALASVHAS